MPPMDLKDVQALEQATELAVYNKMAVAPVRGSGCYVEDAKGVRYLDLYGGHAVALTGHCHPAVTSAIQRQAEELIFYSNAVPSAVRAEASRRLLHHAQIAGSRVFYVNSGTEANEVALKLARKWTQRRVIVSFQGSFHGRTIASLSACGIDKYRKTAAPLSLIGEHRIIPFDDLAALDAAIQDDVAAVLVEPIQSMNGVRLARPEFYKACRELTEARGAALIFDEIQTGMGRTGKFFFGEHYGVAPDLTTLAKGIASGIPCGAVIAAPKVAASASKGDQGTTFGGGHLAMAAMQATVDVIERESLCVRAEEVGRRLQELVAELEGVVEVRGLGLLVGIELVRAAGPVRDALLRRRLIVGGSGEPNTLRLLPPLVLTEAELVWFVTSLGEILADTTAAL